MAKLKKCGKIPESITQMWMRDKTTTSTQVKTAPNFHTYAHQL